MTPTLAFTQALQADVARLQAQHPILAGALDKAFTLLVGGHVFPLEDGRSAHVRSQSDPTRAHLVNGTCNCQATRYHAAPCAHRLALRLYQRTVEQLMGALEEERWEPVATSEAPPTPPSLPEAPASANCHIMLEGRQVQLTLRDTDETRLLQRLAMVLTQYPVPQAPAQASSTAEGWCRKHGLQMTQSHKDGRTWYSHRTDQGWCTGRTRQGRS